MHTSSSTDHPNSRTTVFQTSRLRQKTLRRTVNAEKEMTVLSWKGQMRTDMEGWKDGEI